MTYDPDNIFGKILRGEIPSHKVYEDENVLVMLDVFPQSRGHTLVLPKATSRNLLDADPMELSLLAGYLPKLANVLKEVTGAAGIRLAQFSEAAAGQTVFHLHFHLIPAYEGEGLKPHAGGGRADDAELATLAALLAARLV